MSVLPLVDDFIMQLPQLPLQVVTVRTVDVYVHYAFHSCFRNLRRRRLHDGALALPFSASAPKHSPISFTIHPQLLVASLCLSCTQHYRPTVTSLSLFYSVPCRRIPPVLVPRGSAFPSLSVILITVRPSCTFVLNFFCR